MTRILTIIALLFAAPMLAACEDANLSAAMTSETARKQLKPLLICSNKLMGNGKNWC